MYPYRYRDFSHNAAEAAFAARDQGKFWQMHALMLKNSPHLNRESLIRMAGECGLDVARFTRDLDSMKHKDIIERDKQLAFDLDLYNTPSFFFNGRMVLGNRPYESFEAVLKEEIDAASK